ncbi:MAG: NAD(P)/FAD-dependent oxidoreductase [Vallitalea sp.]|jgi:glycerol-3-phosphate dehydrogenase|nr:NAD(P)/FAD-dependent oxidoreductase [Vallitalea sp.]
MYDVAIIGAGIIGSFIGRELSRYNLKTIIIERNNDVADGTTMANSAIIHAGYDAKAGKNKGKFNAIGNAMYGKVCEELDVPFERVGSLVIARYEEDIKTLEHLYDNGIKNGVPDMKILTSEEVAEMEPNLNKTFGALYAPTAGIISPWEMAIALVENAMENGTELLLNNEVTDISKTDKGYTLHLNDRRENKSKELDTKYVINCAGLYSDKINNMVASPYFKINPRRGQYYILDKEVGDLVNKVIFPCPTEKGKGILVSPTVHGNLLVGPDSVYIDDKEGVETTAHALQYIRETSILTTDKIQFKKVIRTFSGLRATPDNGDFIIEESKEAKGFVNVAGIESPGLSSAPAIAKYVVEEIMPNIIGNMKLKENFISTRRKFIRFAELNEEQKEEMIKKDPRYGQIICRCESITEGEIVDVINRKAGATTVKGVKKRTRAGMGRCQGGFCGPRVVEILSRELNKDMNEILLGNQGSYILTEKTHKGENN